MPDSVHIGIAMEFSHEYARAALRGIVSYARPEKPWIFHILDPNPSTFHHNVRLPHVDGVIGTLIDPKVTDLLREQKVAAVNISNRRTNPGVPRVGTNDHGIGAMVARHFLDRGFTHFAVVETPNTAMSSERIAGFAEELASAGHRYSSFSQHSEDPTISGMPHHEAVRHWLLSLPRPLAVLSTTDAVAWPVLEVCRDAGISVPESVALVSVDNDPMICLLTSPTLSSVAIPAERIGYQAASLMDQLLAGKEAPKEPILVPSKEVVTRGSSDVLAIPDTELAAAVEYIRRNAGDRIDVNDVVRATRIARRSLERKFRTVLGRSPLEEIRRARLERVRELLVNTDLAMPLIAQRSGFDSAVRLTTVFREETGMTPTGFRRQFRVVGGESDDLSGALVESAGDRVESPTSM